MTTNVRFNPIQDQWPSILVKGYYLPPDDEDGFKNLIGFSCVMFVVGEKLSYDILNKLFK